jgi:hypothetical protein
MRQSFGKNASSLARAGKSAFLTKTPRAQGPRGHLFMQDAVRSLFLGFFGFGFGFGFRLVAGPLLEGSAQDVSQGSP